MRCVKLDKLKLNRIQFDKHLQNLIINNNISVYNIRIIIKMWALGHMRIEGIETDSLVKSVIIFHFQQNNKIIFFNLIQQYHRIIRNAWYFQ